MTEPGAASGDSANAAMVAKPSVDASSRRVQASDPSPKAGTVTAAEIDESVLPLTVASAIGGPGVCVVKEAGPNETDSFRSFVAVPRTKYVVPVASPLIANSREPASVAVNDVDQSGLAKSEVAASYTPTSAEAAPLPNARTDTATVAFV